ncbi:hypothetical protein SB87_gp027 [Parapoxvirus red deer/HL953]|uniref:Uncharacterized protein n=1 Tax=Parapoxvirus red deer/HL953 TaxID=1579460 RepID=A0A0A7M9Q0_9POXV|nr:hypothetical protein SB87_gp027 [Parapoxvirus red deer/HL953]AIZ77280.1 hypothetical protein [Parapoxvirus red deer/HL953]
MNHPTSRRAAALVRCLVSAGFDTWAIERDELPLAALMGFTGTINGNFSDRQDYNPSRVAAELSKFSSSCILLVDPDLVTPDLVCTMLQNTTEVTPAMIPYICRHAYCVANMMDIDALYRLCVYGMREVQDFCMSRPLAPFMEHALRRISLNSPLSDLSSVPQAVTLCQTDEQVREFMRRATTSQAQVAMAYRELSHEVLLEVHHLHDIAPLNPGMRAVRNYRVLLDVIPDFMEETDVDFTQFLHPSMLRHRMLLDIVLDELRPHVACRSLYRFLSAEFSAEYIVQRAGTIAYACFPFAAEALFEACGISVALPLTAFELDIIFEHAEVFVDTLDMRAAMFTILDTLRLTDQPRYDTLWRVRTEGCATVAMYANPINDILQRAMRVGLNVDATENLVELQSAFGENVTVQTLEMMVERGAVDMEWFSASTVDMVLPYLDRVLSVEDVLLPGNSDPADSIFARDEVVSAYALAFRNHPMFFGAVIGSSLPVEIKMRIFARATEGGVFPSTMLDCALYSFAYSWSPRLLYNYQPTVHPEVERIEGADLLEEAVLRLDGKTRLMLGQRSRKHMFVVDMMRREGGLRSDPSAEHRLVLVESEARMAVGMKFELRKMAFSSLAHRLRLVSHDLMALLQRGIVYNLVTWGLETDVVTTGFVRALYSVQYNTLHWGNYRTLDDYMLGTCAAFARCNLPVVRAKGVVFYLYSYVAYFVLMWFYNHKEERLEDVLTALDEAVGSGFAGRHCDLRAASRQLAVVVAENALVSVRGQHCFTEADSFVDAIVAGALAKLCEESQSQNMQN